MSFFALELRYRPVKDLSCLLLTLFEAIAMGNVYPLQFHARTPHLKDVGLLKDFQPACNRL